MAVRVAVVVVVDGAGVEKTVENSVVIIVDVVLALGSLTVVRLVVVT